MMLKYSNIKSFIVTVKRLDNHIEEFRTNNIEVLNKTTLFIRCSEKNRDMYIPLSQIRLYSITTGNNTISIESVNR